MSLMGYVDEDVEEMLLAVQHVIVLLSTEGGWDKELVSLNKTEQFLFQLLMEGRIGD